MFLLIVSLILITNLMGCADVAREYASEPYYKGRVGDKEISLWGDDGQYRGWIVDPETNKRKEVKVWDDGTGTLSGWIDDPKTNKREEIKIWR